MLPKRSPCLYDWHFASALTIKANFLEVNSVTISLILMLIISYSSQKGRILGSRRRWAMKNTHPSFDLLLSKGAFNSYVDKMRGGGGQKMSVFIHAQGIKTVHAGTRGSKNGKILST